MALLFCDSFDHYASGDILTKWTARSSSSIFVTSAAGRFNNGLQIPDSTNKTLSKSLGSFQEWIVGFAYRCPTSHTNNQYFLGLMSGGTIQVDLRTNGSSQLFLTRNGTTLNTGATVLSPNVWYYIELRVKIAGGTSGTYDVHLNGASQFSSSGANTSNTGGTSADTLVLRGTDFGAERNFDDLYVCDTTGSVNNNFLGDVRVEALFPNGNGAHSQFTGSDGNSTDNYLLVDESTPNGDTDYVADSNVGDIDTYTFTDPTPSSGSVFGVQINHYSRKTDAGTRSARSVARLGGVETDNGVDQPLSTSYLYYADIRETEPGGSVWTLSDLGSTEFGVKVAA